MPCFLVSKNTAAARAQIIHSATERGKQPMNYLGVPLFTGAPKSAYFQYLFDRIKKKIASWRCSHFKKGGRIVLIQSVLASIPIYLLSVVTPPQSFFRRLEGSFANFLWDTRDDGGFKHHWVSWKDLCLPFQEGGIGLRPLN